MLAPAQPQVSPPPPPAPAHVRLSLSGPHESPSFAFAGDRVTLHGSVSPFVPGQSVVAVVKDAKGKVSRRRLALTRSRGGTGAFALRLPTSATGSVFVRVSHLASRGMAAFSTSPVKLRVLTPDMGEGTRGQGVWFLQRRLSYLHYAVPLSGVFEAGTANAVIAYRKMLGLERTPLSDSSVIGGLERDAGRFRVRLPHDGKHVEANLQRQVLAEIEPHGRVYRIYPISSGKPSTPTVLGHYQVYRKTPGSNSEGMVDSNYFISGYAIHGYAEVPTWAASHGCLRVPIEDAAAIYGWVQIGTIVDVYD